MFVGSSYRNRTDLDSHMLFEFLNIDQRLRDVAVWDVSETSLAML